jgi:ribose/xylose/arabinose/galactoside ABC-type transport system permease subunit
MATITQTAKPVSRKLEIRALRSIFSSQEAVLLLALVLLIALTGQQAGRFFSTRNMANVFSGNAYIAVAAIGMTMVIVTGNIDISVGSLMVTLSMLSGAISVFKHFPSWLPVEVVIGLSWILPLFAGALVGAVIGFLVTYLRIPSIVVTLGFLSILKGLLIIASHGMRITDMPKGYALAQIHPLEKVPLPIFEDFFHTLTMPVFFMIILTILAALWMRYSPTGRAMYAVGGNSEAARLSGISEHRIEMTAFILNGVFVGIAAVLNATQFSVIQVTLPPIELLIITAAVVGGVSILGGTGTVIGAMLAAILLNTITKALVFLDISPFWTRAIQGLLILVTVLADLYRRHRQSA